MSRLTISRFDSRYKALKETAVKSGKTIGQLIAESLEFYGIKSHEGAVEFVRRVRANGQRTESEAMSIAQSEVQAVRSKP